MRSWNVQLIVPIETLESSHKGRAPTRTQMMPIRPKTCFCQPLTATYTKLHRLWTKSWSCRVALDTSSNNIFPKSYGISAYHGLFNGMWRKRHLLYRQTDVICGFPASWLGTPTQFSLPGFRHNCSSRDQLNHGNKLATTWKADPCWKRWHCNYHVRVTSRSDQHKR